MKTMKKIIPLVLCVCIVMLCGCNADSTDTDKTLVYGFVVPSAIDNGVIVEDIYLYSGEYVEDASFENCENVAAIKVINASATDMQLIRIKVETSAKELMFEITTLKSGATVIALDKSKQTLAEDEKIISIEVINRADFDSNVSLMESEFIVQANLSTINIKNISSKEIENDIYVYYKKKDADGNYLGGITFRTKAEGLKTDEIKQLPAANFDPADSEVLFVDYAD